AIPRGAPGVDFSGQQRRANRGGVRIVGAERQIPEHVVRNIERGRRALSGSPEMLRAIADEIQGWTWDSDRIVEQTEERLARIAEMVADLQAKQAIQLRLADAMRREWFAPPCIGGTVGALLTDGRPGDCSAGYLPP